mgnify:CR=1 FL=1
MKFNNLAHLYDYLDELVAQDASADDLFASSYLRGFISLSASQFGDETQQLTKSLAADITEKVQEARSELTPADRVIVNNYWQSLEVAFCH